MRILTAIASMVCLLSIANAEDTVILKESFSGDHIPSAWQPSGKKGAFVMVDGTLQGTASPNDSHGPSIGVPIEGHDLKVKFDFKVSTPGYFLFLIDGDSQFQGQAHLLRFAATSQQIQLMQDRGDPVSKQAQKTERDKNGGKRAEPTDQQLSDPSFYRIERLAQHQAVATDGQWHHFEIELRGSAVTAQLDDKPKMRATGTVFDVRKSRVVFLVGQSGTISVDNVVIENLGR